MLDGKDEGPSGPQNQASTSKANRILSHIKRGIYSKPLSLPQTLVWSYFEYAV